MNHTPGPWKTYDYLVIVADKIIASVKWNGIYGEDEEAAANACLIAAAPQLYEACKQTAACFDHQGMYNEARAALILAIAAAEGRTDE